MRLHPTVENIHHHHKNAMPNGLIVLKGGNVDGEIHPFRKTAEVTPVNRFFPQEWFKEKYVIYLPL